MYRGVLFYQIGSNAAKKLLNLINNRHSRRRVCLSSKPGSGPGPGCWVENCAGSNGATTTTTIGFRCPDPIGDDDDDDDVFRWSRLDQRDNGDNRRRLYPFPPPVLSPCSTPHSALSPSHANVARRRQNQQLTALVDPTQRRLKVIGLQGTRLGGKCERVDAIVIISNQSKSKHSTHTHAYGKQTWVRTWKHGLERNWM